MKALSFDELQEGKIYLRYSKQFDALTKVACVYDHSKPLGPNEKGINRPLKYFIDLTNVDWTVLPTRAQVREAMRDECDDVLVGGRLLSHRLIQALWDFDLKENSFFTIVK